MKKDGARPSAYAAKNLSEDFSEAYWQYVVNRTLGVHISQQHKGFAYRLAPQGYRKTISRYPSKAGERSNCKLLDGEGLPAVPEELEFLRTRPCR